MSPRIEKAIDIAIQIHKGQLRKIGGTTSFVVHPISVAMLLARYTSDEDILTVSLLHDALEDTPCSPVTIKRELGSKVLSIIMEVTDRRPDDCWAKRKEEYLKSLKKASREACLIACADKINNLESLINGYKKSGDAIWEYFEAPKEAKIGFYEAVCKGVGRRFSHPIIRELGNTLKEAKKCLK